MKGETTKAEAAKLFHVRQDFGRRVLPLCPAFDDARKLHYWIPSENNTLMELPVSRVAEGDYFAKQPDSADDFFFFFLHFCYQHVLDYAPAPFLSAIVDDVLNLSASLAKLEFLHANRNETFRLSRPVITEMEYIFSTCRSLYDLLQKVAAALWAKVSGKDLPDSFNSMVYHGESLRSPEDLCSKYGLTAPLANFYHTEAPAFRQIRDLRVKIEHHGLAMQTIFAMNEGFGVSSSFGPLAAASCIP